MTSCNDYNFVRLIGKSSFSSTAIYLTQHRKSSKAKAVRVTELDDCSCNCLHILQKELWVSCALSHHNVLVHEAAFIERGKLYVVTEMMNFGASSDIMMSQFKFGLPEVLIAFLLREVILALEYIHRLGYVHRGVKACHILVSSDGKVKLSSNRSMITTLNDKQRRKNVHDFPKHDIYLLPWLSPEILQQNAEGYNTQSDIYSLGITACELANGHAPFTDMPSTRMLLEKLNGTKPCLLDQTTVPPEPDLVKAEGENNEAFMQHQVTKSRVFSNDFHQFTSCCLNREPRTRPTAAKLLTHPFLRQAVIGQENLCTILDPLVPITVELQKLSSSVDKDIAETSGNMKNMKLNDYEWDFGDN